MVSPNVQISPSSQEEFSDIHNPFIPEDNMLPPHFKTPLTTFSWYPVKPPEIPGKKGLMKAL